MNIAVVLASGRGSRMGADKNKVLLDLAGKPLIYWTLKNFQDCEAIDGILLVAKEEERVDFEKIFLAEKLNKLIGFCVGGAERQDSAHNGLKFLSEYLDDQKKSQSVVLFHNGANPFLESAEIEAGIESARRVGASVLAHPAKDTIKEVCSQRKVKKTLDRSVLWNMQTPQVIQFELAQEAFDSALNEKFLGTDDVSLVERLGREVEVVPASEYNFKITTPLDMQMAEQIIKLKNKNV